MQRRLNRRPAETKELHGYRQRWRSYSPQLEELLEAGQSKQLLASLKKAA